MASIYDWSIVPGNNGSSDADMTWAEGQAPSTVNNSARQLVARNAEILADITGSLSAGGTANGLTVTANSAFTTLANNRIVSFKATADNTGAATLNVNGIGAKAIRKMDSTGDVALGAGEIQDTGIYVVRYSTALNGGAGAWLLVNPTLPANLVGSGGGSTDNAIVRFDGTGGRTVQNSVVFIGDTGIFTGGAWNGTVGATTPATGAFTTLSTSGAATVGTTLGVTGAVTAASFSGSGASLTDLNATNLASGTVASARISGSYTGITGTGALNAGSITSGFGSINIGASTFTTTGAVSAGAISGTTGTFSGAITTTTLTASANVDATGSFRGSASGGVTVLENLSSGDNTIVACFGGGGILFRVAGSGGTTNQGVYDTNGNFTAAGDITANSDERLKTDWHDLEPSFIVGLAGLKAGTYSRKDTGARQVGVSAQWMQALLPEAVREGEDGTLSIAYGQAALVACVALARKIGQLEARAAR